ncbi:phage major tail tube protein [Microbulbifer sp. OS29]|uniref:Phage major tail tube protein n=1 Tax=Microbulbifer okhotskensis TaxID=2926617 RepID=A0A9X2EJ22_9GAMM|nr:phage major tail tube protein [Microbulbifer okhotskensis]MCO1333137.1 phage major tail tube protein [Microbulbifer okhotskensis]
MLDDILKNMALFVDGRGFAGNVEELTLPKLTLKTEEFRNGGMDAPIEVEMGMEKLESEFTLTRFDKNVLKLFGLAPGQLTPLTIRGAVISDDGTQTAVVVNLQGIVREMDPGNWKPGEKATLKIMLALRYYKLTHGGDIVHEIDIPNMVRTIGGVDQLSAVRSALGI